MANVTYIEIALALVRAELSDGSYDDDLVRLYALLVLRGNIRVRDVHDAWAIWHHETNPIHPAIVPFDQLSPAIQRLDVPFLDALLRARERYMFWLACLDQTSEEER